MSVIDSAESIPIPKIPINLNVYASLVSFAAVRLVEFEIENDISVGSTIHNTFAKNIIFPEYNGRISNIAEWNFRNETSKVLQQSTGRKRKVTNVERLSGLKRLEFDRLKSANAIASVICYNNVKEEEK
jgi:hypothetical protein